MQRPGTNRGRRGEPSCQEVFHVSRTDARLKYIAMFILSVAFFAEVAASQPVTTEEALACETKDDLVALANRHGEWFVGTGWLDIVIANYQGAPLLSDSDQKERAEKIGLGLLEYGFEMHLSWSALQECHRRLPAEGAKPVTREEWTACQTEGDAERLVDRYLVWLKWLKAELPRMDRQFNTAIAVGSADVLIPLVMDYQERKALFEGSPELLEGCFDRFMPNRTQPRRWWSE